MTNRVYIAPGTIRVSRPGIDAVTGSLKDMILAIGLNTGQILTSGSILLTQNINKSNATQIDSCTGSTTVGPFSQIPAALIGIRANDGFVHVGNAILVQGSNSPIVVPVATGNVTVSTTGISVSLVPVPAYVNPSNFAISYGAVPAYVDYVLYRRPFY